MQLDGSSGHWVSFFLLFSGKPELQQTLITLRDAPGYCSIQAKWKTLLEFVEAEKLFKRFLFLRVRFLSRIT